MAAKEMKMTKKRWKALQHDMNFFVRKYKLKGLGLLRVDGKPGPSTRGRIKTLKFYLGYQRPINGVVNHDFWSTLNHAKKGTKFNTRSRRRLASRRRIAARARWAKNVVVATVSPGVTMYDGKPVAKWLVPYLDWARTHVVNGRRWLGSLTSGFREPAYSESLCLNMCGHPTCPGRCAGRNSGHSQKEKPRGCADVSDYEHFAAAMRACPLSPRIFNDLPIDRVHFSATGH